MSRSGDSPRSMRSSGPSDGSEGADGGSTHGDGSRPDRLTRRVVWTEETADCASCGATVDLATRHYYVTVDGADADRDELVFCSRACASGRC